MKTFLRSLLFLSLFQFGFSQNSGKIKPGIWAGELQLTTVEKLPFGLEIKKTKSSYTFTVLNADERIELTASNVINDSIRVQFPLFNSELVFKVHSKKHLQGYWINHNKSNYRVPFKAKPSKGNRFEEIAYEETKQFGGKWEAEFSKDGQDAYPALGIFKQSNDKITGTFLTETGDYRFLEGNVYGNQLLLSCFDGSHAFLFKGIKKPDGTIDGKFFSGNHWESEWKAIKNDSFELPNPDSITYVKDNSAELSFKFNDINGKVYNYPNEQLKDKVVIIQFMGTWCPNCMDETRFFKEMYDKYHAQGLEIVSICYEVGDNYDQYVSRVEAYKERLALDFTFLIGGKASKNLASEQFPMLSSVSSFPTSLFIGKDGTIQRIHTGFNGPGTGIYYTDYTKKTEELIQLLLQD